LSIPILRDDDIGIFGVLDAGDITEIKTAIEKCEWTGSGFNIIGHAKNRKKNVQISNRASNVEVIKEKTIKAHEIEESKAYAYYGKIIDPRVASYGNETY
jgi:predicted 2-oxoglutarate/Fe(II)-dependent dioxygenase YbiX